MPKIMYPSAVYYWLTVNRMLKLSKYITSRYKNGID